MATNKEKLQLIIEAQGVAKTKAQLLALEKGMGGVSKDLAKHMRDVRHSKYTNAKWRGSGQSPAQVFGWRWTDHRLDMAMRRLNNSAYNSQLNRMVKSATNPVRYVDTTISAKKVSTPSFSTKLTADNE